MARRYPRSTRYVRKPNTKVWVGSTVDTLVLLASSSTLFASFSASILALRPFTILRTRLELLYTTDQSAASESPNGLFGIGVFSDTAVALGITALPGPFAQPEQDWFVYQGLQHEFTFITGSGIDNHAGSHFAVDSKAMRKVGLDDDVAFVVDQVNAVGSAITMNGRMLLQLH